MKLKKEKLKGRRNNPDDEVHENDANTSGNGNDDNESYHSVKESDSSEDEVAPRNTIGDVPLKFYNEEEHIGYDLTGKKIKKKERKYLLDKFLASADDKKAWYLLKPFSNSYGVYL